VSAVVGGGGGFREAKSITPGINDPVSIKKPGLEQHVGVEVPACHHEGDPGYQRAKWGFNEDLLNVERRGLCWLAQFEPMGVTA
jgi:hypothetical protein